MKVKNIIVDIIGVLVLLSTVINISPVLAQTDDLLANGDFIRQFSGWTINVTIRVSYSWLDSFKSRLGVVVVNSTSNFSRFDIYQVVSVSNNETYRFTIDFFSNSSCFDCYLDIFLYNNKSGIYWLKRFSIGNINGWYSYSEEIYVPRGVWELYIIVHSYDGSFNIGIDSIHLYVIGSNDTVMGGGSEDISEYYFILAYLPVLVPLAFGVQHFI